MSSRHAQQAGAAHPFLTAPIGRLFFSNAVPMMFVLSMGGILNVVDGIFVGRAVGADALAAVSAAFPVVMLVTAVSALLGGGLASVMTRQLGGGERAAAARSLRAAEGLALLAGLALMLLFIAGGRALTMRLVGSSTPVAGMAHAYLAILLYAAPVQLLVGIHADALRSEGGAGRVALLSIAMNVFNIVANFVLIIGCDLGVTGSALGTVLAQLVVLGLLWRVRRRDPAWLALPTWRTGLAPRLWRRIVLLGLPVSLGLLGSAAVSTLVVLVLATAPERQTMLSAYGVVTRLLGLAFLMQMALALATQTLVGHNIGAQRADRAGATLRVGMLSAALWCALVSGLLLACGPAVGGLFTSSAAVVTQVTHIVQVMLLLYVFSGPVLVLALYFQASGRPREAAWLTLAKPWLLTPLAVFGMVAARGPQALWYAFPIADATLLGAVLVVWLKRRARSGMPVSRTGGIT